MKQYTREEVRVRIQAKIDKRQPIIIAGAGCGLVSKAADVGGIDFIGLYHSSYYRWECYRMNNYRIDCNGLVLRMLKGAALVTEQAMLLPGVITHDPTRNMQQYLDDLKDNGASAIMGFPTVAMYDGRLRDMYEDAGYGLAREMAVMKMARKMGLFTMIYAFNPDHVRMYAEADMDAMLLHMGPTAGGIRPCAEGFEGRTLDMSVKIINELTKLARSINPRMFIFSHGGPISSPEDTQYIYDRTDSIGFLGASSIERIPVETPIVEAARAFKAVKLWPKE